MTLTVTNGIGSLERGYVSRLKRPSSHVEREYGDSVENRQNESMKFSGSFTGKSETAAKVMKRSLFRSERFNKFLDYVDAHNIITSSLVALVFAGVLRPATILSLPGKKDKDDKIYASGHSLASALMGFAFSLLITTPLDQAVKKLFDKGKVGSKHLDELNTDIEKLQTKLYKKTLDDMKSEGEITKEQFEKINTKFIEKLKENADEIKTRTAAAKPVDDMLEEIFEEEKISSKFHTMKDKFKALGKTEKYSTDAKKLKDLINTKLAYKTLIKNLPDWIIAIPRAALTIALIPPILKYVFGLEKKKAPEKVEIQPETKQTEKPEVKEDDIIFNRPAFEDFNIGGNK